MDSHEEGFASLCFSLDTEPFVVSPDMSFLEQKSSWFLLRFLTSDQFLDFISHSCLLTLSLFAENPSAFVMLYFVIDVDNIDKLFFQLFTV